MINGLDNPNSAFSQYIQTWGISYRNILQRVSNSKTLRLAYEIVYGSITHSKDLAEQLPVIRVDFFQANQGSQVLGCILEEGSFPSTLIKGKPRFLF